MTSRFERDTAVSPAGDGRYEATIDPSWWILRGPNGGYLAAIVARAVVAEVAEPEQRLRSLTLHYLRAPVEGPCRVDVTVERRGRTLTSGTFRLLQDDVVHIVGVAATAADRSGPEFGDLPVPDVAPPVDPTPPQPEAPPGAPDIPMRRHSSLEWSSLWVCPRSTSPSTSAIAPRANRAGRSPASGRSMLPPATSRRTANCGAPMAACWPRVASWPWRCRSVDVSGSPAGRDG